MRLISACTAGLCCALWGIWAAKQLCQRAQQLRIWHDIFQSFQNALLHLHLSIPALLRFAGYGQAFFLCQWADRLEETPACTLSSLLPSKWTGLTSEEWQVLHQGLCALQSESREAQRAMIHQTLSHIESRMHAAESDMARKRKLYLQLGFLSGAALFILLC